MSGVLIDTPLSIQYDMKGVRVEAEAIDVDYAQQANQASASNSKDDDPKPKVRSLVRR
jgi:hypothetical protein